MKKTKFEFVFVRDENIFIFVVVDVNRDDDKNEIFFEIKFVMIRFFDFSQNQIVKIYINKFKFINLFRLYRDKDYRHEKKNQIHIVDEFMKMKKMKMIFKKL